MDKVISGIMWSGLKVPDWPQDALIDPCLAHATPERPVWATLGSLGPLRVWSGQTEFSWGISKSFWCCKEHFRSVYLSISEPNFVLQISQSSNIAQKWFCIQNFSMDLSFQKEKNGLEICFLVPEIFKKYKGPFFLDAWYKICFG